MKIKGGYYKDLVRGELVQAAPEGLTMHQLESRLYSQVPPENALRVYRRLAKNRGYQAERSLPEQVMYGIRHILRQAIAQHPHIVKLEGRYYWKLREHPVIVTHAILLMVYQGKSTRNEILSYAEGLVHDQHALARMRLRKLPSVERGRRAVVSEHLSRYVRDGFLSKKGNVYRLTLKGLKWLERGIDVNRNDGANALTYHP